MSVPWYPVHRHTCIDYSYLSMHLTPREIDKLMLHQAGVPRAEAARARTPAELRGGGRADRDAAARVHSRRTIRRRADGPRPPAARPGGRARRRGRHDRRGAGRRHVSGRHEARHRPSSDRRRSTAIWRSRSTAASCTPAGGRWRRSPSQPRALEDPPGAVFAADGEIVLNEGGRRRARGGQSRRSADPGRQSLSLRRNEPGARLRSRARRTACVSTSRRARRFGSSRARRRPSRSWPSRARASSAAAMRGRAAR